MYYVVSRSDRPFLTTANFMKIKLIQSDCKPFATEQVSILVGGFQNSNPKNEISIYGRFLNSRLIEPLLYNINYRVHSND